MSFNEYRFLITFEWGTLESVTYSPKPPPPGFDSLAFFSLQIEFYQASNFRPHTKKSIFRMAACYMANNWVCYLYDVIAAHLLTVRIRNSDTPVLYQSCLTPCPFLMGIPRNLILAKFYIDQIFKEGLNVLSPLPRYINSFIFNMKIIRK